MSSIVSKTLRAAADSLSWYADLLGAPLPAEGESIALRGQDFTLSGGILRSAQHLTDAQSQTGDAFGFKWQKRDTFEGAPLDFLRKWLREKYGNVAAAPWLFETSKNPTILDAGCGAAMSALAMFEPVLDRAHYLGIDVSRAVDVAKQRFEERGISAAFMQADINHLPLPQESLDIIFSEGVLHHTDDTKTALIALSRHLKRRGRFLFYVYRKKGPLREYTDDYIRDKLQKMSPEEGWGAMMSLSKLGKLLGDLKIEIDLPEKIELLDIPAGRIDLQRLYYWHVLKAFYRPEMSLEEMNHINFDWYAPKNAHRQTPEQVRQWCQDCGLAIEHERVEEAGITVIARKK